MVTSWSSSPSSPTSCGTTVADPRAGPHLPRARAIRRHARRGAAARRTSPLLVARAVQYGVLRDGELPQLRTTSGWARRGSTSPCSTPPWASPCCRYSTTRQRTTLCRLYNEFMADQYRAYGDRFTVAALIPMNSPEEAIGALEHAKALGSKVGLIASHVHRGCTGPDVAPRRRLGRPADRRMGGQRVDRHIRHRQRLRLRPGVGESGGVEDALGRPHGRHRLQRSGVGHELRLQPDRALRRVRERHWPSRSSWAASPVVSPN